jgi:eukaryotic-like serine/threonine-protein kinase
MSATANAASKAAEALSSAVLDGRYEVFPDRAVPVLGVGSVPAVLAADRQAPDRPLFALVCEAAWQPRYAAVPTIGRLQQQTALLTPLAVGYAEAAANRRVFTIVYDGRIGRRLAAPDATPAAPLAPERVLRDLLLPASATLRAVHAAGLTHRAIRPDNLFWSDESEGGILLGDCLAGPPAAAQPGWVEPIESGMAHPLARGDGQPADDLYALGATALCLASGRLPGDGLEPAALLRAKIERGSLAALLGDARLPAALVEVIGGLLADDPRRRWTLDELQAWLRGKGAPLRHVLTTRDMREFAFDGRGFGNVRLLAEALAGNPGMAAQAVRGEAFSAWVNRWCPERWPAVEQALVGGAARASSTGDEMLVARIAMALDPAAPIRCKGLAMHVDGLGPLLGAALAGGLPLQPPAAAIVARLPQFWLAMQPASSPRTAPLLTALDEVARLMEHREIGCGPERGFYLLMPEAPCLSPLVAGMGVVRPDGVLPALEIAAAAKPVAIDRHLAAFLAGRFKSHVGDWLPALAGSEPPDAYLAMLRVLYRLQDRFGPAAVPAVTASLAQAAAPAIERFRNRAARKAILDSLDGVAAKGRVGDLLVLLDDQTKQRDDLDGYRAARQEYAQLHQALGALGRRMRRRREAAAALGARWAAAVAGLVAGAGLVLTSLVTR